jgi:hypothetical protein
MLRRGSGLALVVALAALASPAAAQRRTDVSGLAFTPDGKTLLSARCDGVLRRHDVETGKVTTFADAKAAPIFGLAVSPDGQTIAAAGADSFLCLYNADGKQVRTLKGHSKQVVAVTFSPDGRTLASGGYDGTVRLWDLASGKEVRSLEVGGLVTGLSFSPDGKTLATAGLGGTVLARVGMNFATCADSAPVRLWDVATGREKNPPPVRGMTVCFAPDGRTLVAGGYRTVEAAPGEKTGTQVGMVSLKSFGEVVLWRGGAGREPDRVAQAGHAVALSADGRFVVTGRGSEIHVRNTPRVGLIIGLTEQVPEVTVREVCGGAPLWRAETEAPGAHAVALSRDGGMVAFAEADGTVQIKKLTPPGWDPKAGERLRPADLERLWRTLAERDAGAGQQAVWTLAAADPGVVPFLKDRLKPVPVDRVKVRRLLADLDSDDFAARTAATAGLAELGSAIEPELRQELKRDVSLEARRRLQELLAPFDGGPLSPEQVRAVRAVQALERMNGAEARAALEALAEDDPEGLAGREARRVLDRLRLR